MLGTKLSITTHLLIPFAGKSSALAIQDVFMRLGALVPYSVEKRVMKKTVRKMILFKQEVEEVHQIENGVKYQDIAKNVNTSIDNGYGNLGHLQDEYFNQLVKVFGGNKGDGINRSNWYPWDVDIEVNVCATWAEDFTDVPGNFISIGGYGNPAVLGNEFLRKIMECGFIDKIVKECGIKIEVIASDYISHLDDKTIMARLSV